MNENYNKWLGDKDYPCTQYCTERKCGCQKGCEKLLIYNIFHKEEDKKVFTVRNTKVDKMNSAFKHRRMRNHTYLGGK